MTCVWNRKATVMFDDAFKNKFLGSPKCGYCSYKSLEGDLVGNSDLSPPSGGGQPCTSRHSRVFRGDDFKSSACSSALRTLFYHQHGRWPNLYAQLMQLADDTNPQVWFWRSADVELPQMKHTMRWIQVGNVWRTRKFFPAKMQFSRSWNDPPPGLESLFHLQVKYFSEGTCSGPILCC